MIVETLDRNVTFRFYHLEIVVIYAHTHNRFKRAVRSRQRHCKQLNADCRSRCRPASVTTADRTRPTPLSPSLCERTNGKRTEDRNACWQVPLRHSGPATADDNNKTTWRLAHLVIGRPVWPTYDYWLTFWVGERSWSPMVLIAPSLSCAKEFRWSSDLTFVAIATICRIRLFRADCRPQGRRSRVDHGTQLINTTRRRQMIWKLRRFLALGNRLTVRRARQRYRRWIPIFHNDNALVLNIVNCCSIWPLLFLLHV